MIQLAPMPRVGFSGWPACSQPPFCMVGFSGWPACSQSPFCVAFVCLVCCLQACLYHVMCSLFCFLARVGRAGHLCFVQLSSVKALLFLSLLLLPTLLVNCFQGDMCHSKRLSLLPNDTKK